MGRVFVGLAVMLLTFSVPVAPHLLSQGCGEYSQAYGWAAFTPCEEFEDPVCAQWNTHCLRWRCNFFCTQGDICKGTTYGYNDLCSVEHCGLWLECLNCPCGCLPYWASC